MNTQSFLFEHSASMPENIYLELMNKLKLDYDSKTVLKVIVIDRAIPQYILIKKIELLESIIVASVSWEDREDVLKTIITSNYYKLKKFCIDRSLPTMKKNPRWLLQQEAIILLRHNHAVEWSQKAFLGNQ